MAALNPVNPSAAKSFLNTAKKYGPAVLAALVTAAVAASYVFSKEQQSGSSSTPTPLMPSKTIERVVVEHAPPTGVSTDRQAKIDQLKQEAEQLESKLNELKENSTEESSDPFAEIDKIISQIEGNLRK